MALSSLQGTTNVTPKSPAPSGNEYVDSKIDVTQTPDQRQVDQGPVKDSYHRSTVLDMNRYGQIIAQIRQYIQGSPIYVTYYHKVVPETNRTEDTDINHSDIEPTYTRINDFELRLTNGLEYSHLTDENISQIVGEATIYPGLTPHVGDMLLYTVDPATGKVGKFKVTSVERLTVRSRTCHRVSLQLMAFVDQSDIDNMEQQVIDVLFFDLRSFMGDHSVLLHTSEKQLLHDIETVEGTLKKFYVKNFFDDQKHHTFVRPDGIYDPYIADFLTYVFGYYDLPEYPRQLMDPPANIYSSFWSGLLDRNTVTPNSLLTHFIVRRYTSEARDGFITSLLNHDYVYLCRPESYDDAAPYITDGIASLDGEEQSDFDKLVRLFYEQREVDPTTLLKQAQDFRDLSEIQQFYRIPVFMFLLSLLRQVIFAGTGDIKYGNAVDYYPTEYEFTNDDLTGHHLIVNMPNKAIGVIAPDGSQKMFNSDEVRYSDGNIHVDLLRIFKEYYSSWQFADDASVYTASWNSGSSVLQLENSSNIELDMAVKDNQGKIPETAHVVNISGNEVTISSSTANDGDVTDAEVTIDYPVIPDQWTLVLTGNTVPE